MKTESRERLMKLLFYVTVFILLVITLFLGKEIIVKWGEMLLWKK